MTFVSFAQNFEDVMLRRALGDVERGQYVDIGAQDPVAESVSLAFYKSGWRGIHVEPTPHYVAKLREARPDEVVIEAAVTDEPGPISFYEIPGTGLSTGVALIADHHAAKGWQKREIVVPCVRLEKVLNLLEPPIHWMKIDVEGMEADVLRSWGDSPVRPWIILVESTFPLTQEPTEHKWEKELLDRGYRHCFYDGLSRYFVHETQSERLSRFDAPANIFDNFSVGRQHFAAATLRSELEAAEQLQSEQVTELTRLQGELVSSTERLAREHEEHEIALQSAHALADTRLRERELAEAEFSAKEEKLRSALDQSERDVAASRAEKVRFEERSAQLSERLAHCQAMLTRSEGQASLYADRAFASEARLAIAEAGLTEAIRALKDAESIAASILADRGTVWHRAGQALGFSRSSPTKRLLERWMIEHRTCLATMTGGTSGATNIMATNTTSDVPGAVSSEISLPALLSAEGEDFVRLAYRAVLGREVDHSGEAYYNDRLRQGYSKLEILGQLRKSKEAAGRESVANLDEVLGRQGILRLALGRRRAAEILEGRIISKPFNIHVNHFMRYHDEEFVTQIFQFYLGRKPDGPGLAYYLNQLRAGKSRQQLLLDVARSREARARGAKAAGQTSVAIALAADQIPVVRTLVAIARFNLRIRQHLRDMRALQNHLYRVSKSLH